MTETASTEVPAFSKASRMLSMNSSPLPSRHPLAFDVTNNNQQAQNMSRKSLKTQRQKHPQHRSPHRSLSASKSAFTPLNGLSSPSFSLRSTATNGTVIRSSIKTPSNINNNKNNSQYRTILTPSRTITESLTAMVSETAEQLDEVWDQVGYNSEERMSQLSDLLVQFRNLCQAKLAEEQGVAETFRHTIAETKSEIVATSEALHIPVDENLLSSKDKKTALTDELAILEATLEGLRETAAIATADLKEMQNYLVQAHEILGLSMEEEWKDITSDLTVQRRDRFRRKVDELKEEMATRSSAVIQLLRDCQHLIKDLCVDTTGPNALALDRQIDGSLVRNPETGGYTMASNRRTETCTGISANALEDLTDRITTLNAEKRRRTVCLEEMGAKIMTLWEKLRIPEQEQMDFSESIQGLGPETIAKGEAELERLLILKSEMLGKLILEARETIVGLWDEMNATEQYKGSFGAFRVTDDSQFNEELLEIHEGYVDYLREQLDEMKPILRIIERREVILRERKEYQELQKDSERLQQRGAALTQQLMREEKMARRIKRDLPKLTTLLEEKLQEWIEKHEQPFQLHGTDYAIIMQQQEADWTEYKNSLALEKEKKKNYEKDKSENDGKGRVGGRLAPITRKVSSTRPFGDAASRENRGISRMRGRENDRAVKPRSQIAARSQSRAPAI